MRYCSQFPERRGRWPFASCWPFQAMRGLEGASLGEGCCARVESLVQGVPGGVQQRLAWSLWWCHSGVSWALLPAGGILGCSVPRVRCPD